jgi:hypothetical protein
MSTNKVACCAALIFASTGLAQPIKSWSNNVDYCHDNPDAPTCRDGKPINVMEEMQRNAEKLKANEFHLTTDSPAGPSPAAPQIRTAPPRFAPQITRVPRGRASSQPAMVQVGVLDWRFAHPHPDLLIGMDMENLLESELLRTLLRTWAGKLGVTPEEQEKMLTGLGDVKRVLISVYNRDMLAMMVGNIGNLPQGPQAGGLQFTRLSEDTVLMGSEGGSAGASIRLKVPPLPNPQLEEPKLMARTYDFWVWGRPERLAGLSGGMSGNTPVTKIKMGVSFRDGFNLQMILDTPDGATAARLFEGMQKGAPRGMLGAVEGNSVRYAMVLNRDAALQRMAGFMTDSFGKNFAPLVAAARQISARQAAGARPSTGKVIIDGLDDGPREVPLSQRQ